MKNDFNWRENKKCSYISKNEFWTGITPYETSAGTLEKL